MRGDRQALGAYDNFLPGKIVAEEVENFTRFFTGGKGILLSTLFYM